MDSVNWLRFVAAFILVLGLIGMCALALRKWGGKLALTPRGSQSRLKVVDVCYLGTRQRLLLIKRDETEHLLLISGDQAQVVESNVQERKV